MNVRTRRGFIGLCVYYFVAFGLIYNGLGMFLSPISQDLGIPFVQVSVTSTVRILVGMVTTAAGGAGGILFYPECMDILQVPGGRKVFLIGTAATATLYGAGIWRKILQLSAGGGFDALFYLGFVFYIFNMSEVTVDMLLYFRNRRLDRVIDSIAIE